MVVNQKVTELRAATIEVSARWLKDILLGAKKPYKSNIPEDIQIFDVHYDSRRHVYSFVGISDEFDVVPEGMTIPSFIPTYEIIDGDSS